MVRVFHHKRASPLLAITPPTAKPPWMLGSSGRASVPNQEPGEEEKEVQVYALGSTQETRDLLAKHKIEQFGNGIITGVSGVLLNLGKKENINAISILAEANPNYPDARAAAKVIEAIDKLLPGVKIDVKPLYTEAENIEKTLRMMQKQAAPAQQHGTD